MKKILSIAFAALLATSSFAQKSETLLERNQLAKTPPMGWMTWNLFKGDISDQIYVRPLANGSHAIAILNCGDKDKSIQADFKQLGLNGKYLIRDVWQHRDIAKKANRWKGTVKAHETKVFVLK